ncbi:hypothetical protein EPI10_001007 [Gossypium australe]|uniref:Uncharacterized protein n=1 Tax=Gossypium australe TaxID=47621 RepID=A0A5B6VA55_9ROSI|nr:hypothetical protein EPI10_001007 [Gossypium australe]
MGNGRSSCEEFALPSIRTKSSRAIHHRDSKTPWRTSFHYLRSRSPIHFEILENFSRSLGFEIELQFYLSSINRWPIRKGNIVTGRYAAKLCIGVPKKLGAIPAFGRVRI